MAINYLNMDKRLIRKGGRFAVKISKEDLADKLLEKLQDCEEFDISYRVVRMLGISPSEVKDIDLKAKGLTSESFYEIIADNFYSLAYEISSVAKDLKNFEMSPEDFFFNPDDEEMVTTAGKPPYNYIGLQTLDNGFTYLGGVIGGCDMPMFIIFYFDGKNLRSYIPRYGNPIDLKNKSSLGYDGGLWDDGTSTDDVKDYLDYHGITDNRTIQINWDAVSEDITNRIVVK